MTRLLLTMTILLSACGGTREIDQPSPPPDLSTWTDGAAASEAIQKADAQAADALAAEVQAADAQAADALAAEVQAAEAQAVQPAPTEQAPTQDDTGANKSQTSAPIANPEPAAPEQEASP